MRKPDEQLQTHSNPAANAEEQRALAVISSFVAIFTRLATYPYTLRHLDELIDDQKTATAVANQNEKFCFRLVRFLCAPLRRIAELWQQQFSMHFVINYLNNDFCKSELDIVDKLPLVDSFFDLSRLHRIQFLLTLSSIQSEINDSFSALIRDNCLPEYLRLEHYGPSIDKKEYWFVIDYRGNFKLFEENFDYSNRLKPNEASTKLIAESRKELETFLQKLKDDLDNFTSKLKPEPNVESKCTICACSSSKLAKSTVQTCDQCDFSTHEDCIISLFGEQSNFNDQNGNAVNLNESLNSLDDAANLNEQENPNDELSNTPKCLVCIHQSLIDDFEILKDWFSERKAEAAREDALEAKRRKREKIQIERVKTKHENDLIRYKKELDEFEEKKHKIDQKTQKILKKSIDALYKSIQDSTQKIFKRPLSTSSSISPFTSESLTETIFNELDFISEAEEEMFYLEPETYADAQTDVLNEIEALDQLEESDNVYDNTTDHSEYSSNAESFYEENANLDNEQISEPCSPTEPSVSSTSDLNTNSLIDSFTSSLQINKNYRQRLNKNDNSDNEKIKFDRKSKRGRPKATRPEKANRHKKDKHSRHRPQGADVPFRKKYKTKALRAEELKNREKQQNNSISISYPGSNGTNRFGGQMRKVVRNFKYNPLALFESESEQIQGLNSPDPFDTYHPNLSGRIYDNDECDQNNSLLIFNDTFVDPDDVDLKILDKFDVEKIEAEIKTKQASTSEQNTSKPSFKESKSHEDNKHLKRSTAFAHSDSEKTIKDNLEEPLKKRLPLQVIESDNSDEEGANQQTDQDPIETNGSKAHKSQQRTRNFTFMSNEDESENEVSEEEIQNIVDSLFDTGAADLLINNHEELIDNENIENNQENKQISIDQNLAETSNHHLNGSILELPEFNFTELLQSLV